MPSSTMRNAALGWASLHTSPSGSRMQRSIPSRRITSSPDDALLLLGDWSQPGPAPMDFLGRQHEKKASLSPCAKLRATSHSGIFKAGVTPRFSEGCISSGRAGISAQQQTKQQQGEFHPERSRSRARMSAGAHTAKRGEMLIKSRAADPTYNLI